MLSTSLWDVNEKKKIVVHEHKEYMLSSNLYHMRSMAVHVLIKHFFYQVFVFGVYFQFRIRPHATTRVGMLQKKKKSNKGSVADHRRFTATRSPPTDDDEDRRRERRSRNNMGDFGPASDHLERKI